MGPLHSSGSTKMDSSLESTLITLAQQIFCVWGCICPEDSKRSSHSLRSKRLSLELTSVSLGVQTQGGNNIHKKIVRNFHFPGQSLCRMIQQEGQLQQEQQPRLTLTLIWSGWGMKERRLLLRRNLSRGDPLTSLRLSTVTLAKPR